MQRSTRRRVLAVVAGLVLVPLLMVAVQVWAARSRSYLTASDAPVVAGRFGSGPQLRLVLVGDSTAAGVGASSAATTVGARLAERLSAALGRQVVLDSVAVPGARVADLPAQLEQAAALDPDVLVLLIGANDVTHLTPLDDVGAGMRLAVNQAQTLTPAVVVGTAPEMGARNFARPLRDIMSVLGRRVAREQNEAVREAGGVAVPLRALVGPAFRDDPATLSSDEFHPSDVGYGLWADALAPAVVEAVRSLGTTS